MKKHLNYILVSVVIIVIGLVVFLMNSGSIDQPLDANLVTYSTYRHEDLPFTFSAPENWIETKESKEVTFTFDSDPHYNLGVRETIGIFDSEEEWAARAEQSYSYLDTFKLIEVNGKTYGRFESLLGVGAFQEASVGYVWFAGSNEYSATITKRPSSETDSQQEQIINHVVNSIE